MRRTVTWISLPLAVFVIFTCIGIVVVNLPDVFGKDIPEFRVVHQLGGLWMEVPVSQHAPPLIAHLQRGFPNNQVENSPGFHNNLNTLLVLFE